MRKQHRPSWAHKPAAIVGRSELNFSSTTVCIDDPGLHKAHFKIMQDCGLMQVAEGSEVVLPHQDVRVAKRRQFGLGRVNRVVAHLCRLYNRVSWCCHKSAACEVAFYLQPHFPEATRGQRPQGGNLSGSRLISTHVLRLGSILCCTEGGEDSSGN